MFSTYGSPTPRRSRPGRCSNAAHNVPKSSIRNTKHGRPNSRHALTVNREPGDDTKPSSVNSSVACESRIFNRVRTR